MVVQFAMYVTEQTYRAFSGAVTGCAKTLVTRTLTNSRLSCAILCISRSREAAYIASSHYVSQNQNVACMHV